MVTKHHPTDGVRVLERIGDRVIISMNVANYEDMSKSRFIDSPAYQTAEREYFQSMEEAIADLRKHRLCK